MATGAASSAAAAAALSVAASATGGSERVVAAAATTGTASGVEMVLATPSVAPIGAGSAAAVDDDATMDVAVALGLVEATVLVVAAGVVASRLALGGVVRGQKAQLRHLHRSQWKRANLAWQNSKHLASLESPLNVEEHAAPSARPKTVLTVARGGGGAPAAMADAIVGTEGLAALVVLLVGIDSAVAAAVLAFPAPASEAEVLLVIGAVTFVVALDPVATLTLSAGVSPYWSEQPEHTVPASRRPLASATAGPSVYVSGLTKVACGTSSARECASTPEVEGA